jgi:internalin A
VLNGRKGEEDADVEYWLKLIDSFGKDSPVIIVLNKIMSEPFELNRRGLQEKYPGKIREFVRTDCKEDVGIDDLRQVILRETDRLPHLRDNFPHNWFIVKERLSRRNENYISFAQYREFCSSLGEDDEEAQESLARALHCLGIALNYKDDPRLSDLHVLNPHWVTNAIYKLLNSELVQRQRGEVAIGDLSSVLDPAIYPTNMHEFVLSLMRKFELCFRFPEPRDDRYLIPQLLGKEQPQLGSEFEMDSCLNFVYDYPVWPEGLLPRFIVRTHALSNRQHRWRTGVVLEFEGNRALVKADPQEKRVAISVAGPRRGRRQLLAIIRSDFERIHADLPKLCPIPGVPLPESPSTVLSYHELQALEQARVPSMTRYVEGVVRAIDIQRLLEDVEMPRYSGGPIDVFVSYSHKDDELRAELDVRLKLFQRQGAINAWHDRRISPGDRWKDEIDEQMERAKLVLFLVSADFIASDYCYGREMERALQRSRERTTTVIPIIVRDCMWQETPLAEYEALPEKGRPLRSWPAPDPAWQSVAQGISRALAKLRAKSAQVH